LRSVHTWFSSDVRLGVNVIITTTYKNFSYPSAAEVAGAEQAAGEAQQMQIWASTLRDRAMKLAPWDPMTYFLTGRVIVDRLDFRDRLACDGLVADPGNPQLHALRARTYEMMPNGKLVSEAIADAATAFDAPCSPDTCIALSRRLAAKDSFTSYCAALQTDARSHLALAAGLELMNGYTLGGVELMPEALEQAQLEYAVVARIAAWAAVQPGANAATFRTIINEAQTGRDRCHRAIG
jgi:hypothetical protein